MQTSTFILIILLVGGLISSRAQDTWIQKKDFGYGFTAQPAQRTNAVSFSIGNKGYMGTGVTPIGWTGTNDFWEFDPDLNVWTQKADFGGGGRFDAVGFSIGEKGYIGTGVDLAGWYWNEKNDFWEYDPETNVWSQKSNFGGSNRIGAVGFSIGNKGYIGIGNSYDNGFEKDLWEYDPVLDSWTKKADFAGIALYNPVGFSIGTKGYIGIGSLMKDFWEYDAISNTWTKKADFGGEGRSDATGFSIGSKGYIGTGYVYDGTYYYFNDFWEYDPELDVWLQKADFGGEGRYNATGFSIGSEGYIGTGGGESGDKLDFWKFTPDINTWSQVEEAPPSSARYGAVGFSIGNRGYIGTGLSNEVKKKDFWEYDPIGDTWTQKADFGGTARIYAVGFSIADKGYIGTGSAYPDYCKDFWEYDPIGNTWTQKADFGGPGRYSAAGFSIGSKGYLGTGYDGYHKKDFWEYDPELDVWLQKADFKGEGRLGAVGFSISNKGYIGTGRSGSDMKDFWEYDPAINTWTKKADFGGTAREMAVGFSIADKGYIGTGQYNSYVKTKDFWEYDPSEDVWKQKAEFGGMPRGGSVGFSISAKGYIGTGYAWPNYYVDFWEYTPPPCTPFTVYADADADGYGNLYDNYFVQDCIVPEGYVKDSTDCNDADATVHALSTFYIDTDSDTYGAGPAISICYIEAPAGYSINNTDCNEANASINPSATEIVGDNIDNNCNGITDEIFCTGIICATAEEGGTAVLIAPAGALITSITFASYGTPQGTCPNFTYGTCNASSSQSVVESYALNQNSASIPAKNSIFGDPCSGTSKRLYIKAIWTGTIADKTYFADADGDGYGDSAVSIVANGCAPPFGYVQDTTDCNDANSEINPGASETFNGLDDNCNGVIDECNAPTGLLTKDITATSVKFKWEYSAASYKLRYKVATSGTWTLLGPTGQTKTVEGLLSNTKYVWQVKSVCNVDPKITSEWSAKQFFTTTPLRMGDEQVTAIKVYPNPTAEKFILDLRLYSTDNQLATIYLLNTLGQVVYSSVESVGNGELIKTITMPSTSAAGWYVVRVVMSNQVIEQKLLYQK